MKNSYSTHKGRKRFMFFALAALGKGISGGDRIFIEFAKRWSRNFPIDIYVGQEGYEMCRRQYLADKNITFNISRLDVGKRFGFLGNYVVKIVVGIILGLTVKLATNDQIHSTIVYSASEFWMDSLPCFILKLRYPKITWLAAWYQTAPNPIRGYIEQETNIKDRRAKVYFISAFTYWLMQLPIKPLISGFADYVLVNNEKEKKQFPQLNTKGKVIVVLGAVPLEEIKNLKLKIGNLSKVYDAVFQGRFHPQKGVVELMDIWKNVVKVKPGAKLAMIGDGPLMRDVKLKIKNLKLGNNVKLFGYVFDGPEKYIIFLQSKIVVHPAFYDSGGMASAEAMAFGLPCVGFNLKSYESYYPKGMLKVKSGDLKGFARTIIELLSNSSLRTKIAKEAVIMIENDWSWNKRAVEVLEKINV